MNKMGQDLLLRSKAMSTFLVDVRYRDFAARDLLSAALLAVLLIYTILLVVYRLRFSPIAAFPGPKLAAATEWYEFYYHIVKNGQFGHTIQKLHDIYGERQISELVETPSLKCGNRSYRAYKPMGAVHPRLQLLQQTLCRELHTPDRYVGSR